MLNQLQKKGREEGFTLIELLVVVAIIGILAAIAIPQYASYKQTAVDASMKSDLHNAATAMEAAYGDNDNTYAGVTLDDLKDKGYRQSGTITMAIDAGADDTSYSLTATASGGSQDSFSFDSQTGQIE